MSPLRTEILLVLSHLHFPLGLKLAHRLVLNSLSLNRKMLVSPSIKIFLALTLTATLYFTLPKMGKKAPTAKHHKEK
jgi:hypothetical protein